MIVRRSLRAAAIVSAGVLALTGCSGDDGRSAGGSGAQGDPVAAEASATTPAPPAVVAFSPADRAAAVRPDAQVKVGVTGGTLKSVTVAAPGGVLLPGAVTPDGAGWAASGALTPGTTYTVTAVSADADGRAATKTSTFTTLKPTSTNSALFVPGDGWTVGVGMPVVIQFSKPVRSGAKDDVIRKLTVTSTPQVEGAWRWFSSRQLQWRPKQYWPAGTQVKVAAQLDGVELSPGVWGKNSTSSFKVGSAMISSVDMKTHRLTVRRDGKVLRTIPITTGKSGFQTRRGVKVIMSRETSRQMNSETTGISQSNPEYYNVNVKYAMRLTYSGEFLHAAPWSVGSQGRANVSHGCTGMSTANARWLFSQSKVGDVVVYSGSNRALEWGNGYTAWDMSYDRWISGA